MRALITVLLTVLFLTGPAFAGDPKEDRIRNVENAIFVALRSVGEIDLFPKFVPLLNVLKGNKGTSEIRDVVQKLLDKGKKKNVDFAIITTEALFIHDPEFIAQMIQDNGQSNETLKLLFQKALPLSLQNPELDNGIRKALGRSLLNIGQIAGTTSKTISDVYSKSRNSGLFSSERWAYDHHPNTFAFQREWSSFLLESNPASRGSCLAQLLKIDAPAVLPVILNEFRKNPDQYQNKWPLNHEFSKALTHEILNQAKTFAQDKNIAASEDILKSFVIKNEIGIFNISNWTGSGTFEQKAEAERLNNHKSLSERAYYEWLIQADQFIQNSMNFFDYSFNEVSSLTVVDAYVRENGFDPSLRGTMLKEVFAFVDQRDREWVAFLVQDLLAQRLFQLTYVQGILIDLLKQVQSSESSELPSSVTEGSSDR